MWPFSKFRRLEAEIERLQLAASGKRGTEVRCEWLDAQLGTTTKELASIARQRDEAKETAESFAVDLEEAQRELKSERTLRIGAEAIATDRLKQIQQAYESLSRAEAARDEAVRGRFASLDLVNTALLGAMAPEQPPKNVKEFTANMTALPKKMGGVFAARQSDIAFVKEMMARKNKPLDNNMPQSNEAESSAEQPEPAVAAV